MIKIYEAFLNAGADKEHASDATAQLETEINSLRSRVDKLEVKVNILIGLAMLQIGMIGGLYAALFNIMSRLPR